MVRRNAIHKQHFRVKHGDVIGRPRRFKRKPRKVSLATQRKRAAARARKAEKAVTRGAARSSRKKRKSGAVRTFPKKRKTKNK